MTAAAEPPDATLATAWLQVHDRVAADGQIPAVDKAFMDLVTPLGVLQGVIVIAAPDELAKDVVDVRLRPALLRYLAETYGRRIGLAVTADLDPQLGTVRTRLGIAGRPLAPASEHDRAHNAARVRAMLREWNGYDPTPEEEAELTAQINRQVGRAGT